MSKEAMKLALDAFKFAHIVCGQARVDAAIKALEEALAKQEQGEPVAWNLKDVTDAYKLGAKSQQRTWVGLTEEEIKECFTITPDQYLHWHIYKRIEQKLKERNT